jgi:hypothetical protein
MKKKRPSSPAEGSWSLISGLAERELVLIAVVFVVGAALRLVALSRSAVEHFDEGVYASNVYFPPPEYAYPAQRFYAPPLVPVLIETSMTAGLIIGMPANMAALLPGVVAGCATIVALWFVGRAWFSPRAGLAAAALAAISPFHIVYSAAALTDVWLGLWLLLAVDAAARSLVGRDLRWAVGAGLYTGLAWWTKYNGWLPLAIEGAGLAVLAAVSWLRREGSGFSVQGSGGPIQKSERRIQNLGRQPPVILRSAFGILHFGCYATTVVVALLAWSPYWFSLQSLGGYGPIAGNHAKYVVGFAGWLTSAARQVAGFSVVDQHLTAAGILAAFVVAASAHTAGTKPGPGAPRAKAAIWPIVAGLVIASVSLFTAPLLSLAALSAVGLAVVARRLLAGRVGSPLAPLTPIGGALLLAWWGGLFIATPCYWPYPRLLLPWLLAAWLAIGAAVDQLCSGGPQGQAAAEPDGHASAGPPHVASNWRWSTATVGALLATLPLAWCCRPAAGIGEHVASNRQGVERVARQMHADLDKHAPNTSPSAAGEGADVSHLVYVLGEPPLLFQLATAGEALVRPVEQIPTSAALYAGEPLPTFLALGPHAARDSALQSAWPGQAGNWRLMGQYPCRPSGIVWLDLHNPLSHAQDAAGDGHPFRLYEFQPPTAPMAADSEKNSKN